MFCLMSDARLVAYEQPAALCIREEKAHIDEFISMCNVAA